VIRLTPSEIKSLIQALDTNGLSEMKYSLALFGSRTDPNKKGGDIDLLLLLDPKDYQKIMLQKHLLVSALKLAVGDQRVDLTVMARDQAEENPFYLSIKADLVYLR
jgi:hypothetical protein